MVLTDDRAYNSSAGVWRRSVWFERSEEGDRGSEDPVEGEGWTNSGPGSTSQSQPSSGDQQWSLGVTWQ